MRYPITIFALLFFSGLFAGDTLDTPRSKASALANDGLTLPAGFTADVVIDSLGRNRHIVVNSNGDIYVKLERLKDGRGIYQLRPDSDGKATIVRSFGNYPGTGIAIRNGYLYASSNAEVFRYKLNERNEPENPDAPQRIVKGLLAKRQHESKSIALDKAGNIYVNIGAPSNACQFQDRAKGSKGQDPCPILDSAGGIWQFSVDRPDQSYGEGVRYATGLRNVVGLDWNDDVDDLYVLQHGRDMLFQFYPEYFDQKAGAELPSEEMFRVKRGANYGWPYCYFDQIKNQKLLAPEYGGDGSTIGRCESAEKPIAAFPGHIAPNALVFYTGNAFPEKYKHGAFIAFHGSWNRAPEPQEGFLVAFVPFRNGMPSGKWEVFASGFKGADVINQPGQAKYRPCGLAQGPDGALYVSDSVKGRIWKIRYTGK